MNHLRLYHPHFKDDDPGYLFARPHESLNEDAAALVASGLGRWLLQGKGSKAERQSRRSAWLDGGPANRYSVG